MTKNLGSQAAPCDPHRFTTERLWMPNSEQRCKNSASSGVQGKDRETIFSRSPTLMLPLHLKACYKIRPKCWFNASDRIFWRGPLSIHRCRITEPVIHCHQKCALCTQSTILPRREGTAVLSAIFFCVQESLSFLKRGMMQIKHRGT